MRIAVLGAAAAAFLGGTLAVTPLTTVSAPMPAGGTCSNGAVGAGCEKLASVLMPEAPPPAAQHAEQTPFAEAGNVAAPGAAPEPGGPSAASEVPTAGGIIGGGAPAVGGTAAPGVMLPGVPDDVGLGGIPDPYALAGGVPGLAGLAGLAAVPNSAAVALSLVQGVVGVGGSLVGVGTGVMSTVYMGAIAAAYLKNAGLLPNVSLPSVSIPGLSNLTNAVAAPALAAIPGAAAAIPAVGLPAAPALPAVGLPAAPALPAVGLPAAPALPALPALPGAGLPAAPALPALPALPGVGLPAAPALPALPALPGVGLPALPPLPGPPAIPHPRFCTPSLGPIGACTP